MAGFHGHPVPAHVTVTETVLGGVRCTWYDDARAPVRRRVLFHCHGGGLVSCPLDDYHFYGAMLAEQLEARVVMADYRLAPEHPFPAAHEDCLDAYHALVAGGDADAASVVVSGDSCGGLLGLGTLLGARRRAAPRRRLRVHLRLVRPLGRPPRGRRARSVPHGRVGAQPGPGVRRRGGGARRPARLPGLRRARGAAAALPARGEATRSTPASSRWRRRRLRRGSRSRWRVAGHGARLAGPGRRRRARGAGLVAGARQYLDDVGAGVPAVSRRRRSACRPG